MILSTQKLCLMTKHLNELLRIATYLPHIISSLDERCPHPSDILWIVLSVSGAVSLLLVLRTVKWSFLSVAIY